MVFKKFKKRSCRLCGKEFLPTKQDQRDCDPCMTDLSEINYDDPRLQSIEDEIAMRKFKDY